MIKMKKKIKRIIEIINQNSIGKYEENVLISKLTTYQSGGVADLIVFPKNVERFILLLKELRNLEIPFKVIGNGSNLLFSDDEYHGALIKLSELNSVTFHKNGRILVEAGYSLMKLSLQAAKRGFTGLEFASGIPGTVGGAIYMNAGAYKSDMGYILRNVRVLTPDYRVITLENKELDFHYRKSFFQTHPGYICLEAEIKLSLGDRESIESVIQERKERRVASQPLEYPSAGSVFRNPEGDFAGRLIESLGLKGKRHGGAMISDKHANFIVNENHATSSDIKYLIDLAHDKVLEAYGVDLKIEQEFVNWE